MSKKQTKKKSLHLLEKLVQESGEGEANHERQILYDSLIKETGGGSFYKNMNGNYVEKSAPNKNKLQRESRQRVKNKTLQRPPSGKTGRKTALSETEKQDSISIPLADSEKNGLGSSSHSRSSSSSFWSSRSRSNSRSPGRGSRSRTPPRRRSRSMTPPRRRSRSLSKSLSRSRSRSSSSSHSSAHSVPKTGVNHLISGAPHLQQRETMSEQGKSPRSINNKIGKKKKLLHRSPLRKFRSLEMNPDLYIEEKLNKKYKELKELVHSSFGDKRPQVTRKYLYQMEVLRDQYKKVSHGLPPSGLLLPADIPADDNRIQGNNKFKRRTRPQSANSAGTSTFGEDTTYGTIYSVMTGSLARDHNLIRTDVHAGHRPRPKSKKKSKQKRKDSQSTIDTPDFSSLDKTPTGSTLSKTNSSPRSHMPPEPTDHHVKYSNNAKLLSWLKKKDSHYRKQKKEERMKKREEKEKAVMDANEKFERRLESQKEVQKWMNIKRKEGRMRSREERQRKKEEATLNNNYHLRTTPGTALKNERLSGKAIRPQSAPSARKGDNSEIRVENTKGAVNGDSNSENIKEWLHQTRDAEEEKKQALNAEKVSQHGPHPPASKFIYKRPVAGRIKLNIRPKSASSATAQRDKSKSPERGRDNSSNNRARMSYDDWLNEKRKQDQIRKAEIKIQKEELAKSDPELAKIVPDIAKKRIHRVLEGKKSIDTGIKRVDEKANNSFGGGNFSGEESEGDLSPTRFSYRLEQDRPASSRKTNPKALKVAGQGMHGTERPQTAPPRSNKVPAPKISSSSPRKAVVPQKNNQQSDEVSSAFKVPFPDEQGVPKHVASVQRKLFAEKVWNKLEDDEERPEPQGCDSTEPPLCPQTNTLTNNTPVSDSTGDKYEKEKDNILDNNQKEEEVTETKSTDSGEKQGTDQQEDPGYAFFVTERTEDQVQEEDIDADGEKQQSQEDDVQQKSDTEDPNEDDVSLSLRPGSVMTTSRSAKHVSFREETEILGTEEGGEGQLDWSTDTATPDEEDYVASHAERDLQADSTETVDSFGQELNNSSDLGLPGKEGGRDENSGKTEDVVKSSSSEDDSGDEGNDSDSFDSNVKGSLNDDF